MENSIIQEDSNINQTKTELAFRDCFLSVDSVFNFFSTAFLKGVVIHTSQLVIDFHAFQVSFLFQNYPKQTSLFKLTMHQIFMVLWASPDLYPSQTYFQGSQPCSYLKDCG